MAFSLRRPLGVLGAMAIVLSACGSRTGLFAPEPPTCEVPDEKSPLAQLALVFANDRSRTADNFVTECGISAPVASAIVDARRKSTFSIPRLFAALSPDAASCNAFLACAKKPNDPCSTKGATGVLEFVVDESGSMAGEKWDALRDALLALFTQMAADADSGLYVGALGFDNSIVARVEPGPLTDPNQLADLREMLDKKSPHGGGTSTKKALDAAYKVVESDGAASLILLTDGVPTGLQQEQDECVELAKTKAGKGVDLYSVGIGPFPSDDTYAYNPSFMGKLAQAGHTAPTGCDPDSEDLAEICHYQITPGSDAAALEKSLVTALSEIRRTATTCR